MGSVFTTKPDVFIVDPLTGRDTIPTPFYIQFVPGSVTEVVTSLASNKSFNNPENLNSIIAEPHILPSDKLFKDRITDSEKNRYIPLFRGMTDVPVKGDPVLLCTIGKINYYLGPLNTDNAPTLNNDNLYIPRQDTPIDGQGKATETEARGQSLNFVNTKHRRLSKKYKPELDGESITWNEIHGDQIFEGRHGNSIRIGSRNINPYIFISNERGTNNVEESIIDGSLISITSNGTLQQHFGGYEDTKEEVSVPGFVLASDWVKGNSRTIGSMIQSVNFIDDSYPYLYEFGNSESEVSRVGGTNQMVFHSDRIIINSKKNDVIISSFNDIHLGSGKNLTISTNEDLIIDSDNTYLGKKNVNQSEREMEAMVLGNTLFELLTELVETLSDTQFYSVYAGGTALRFPLIGSDKKPVKIKFDSIQNKLKNIKSNNHWIEPNPK